MKRIIYCVVEGWSEVAYLNELNKLYRELERDYIFIAIKATNGFCKEIRKCYKRVREKHKKARIEIIVDKDIFLRDEKERKEYEKMDDLPPFSFSIMNFEDFLILHLDFDKVKGWHNLCVIKEHNKRPMVAKEYMPLIKEMGIFGEKEYKKGEIPFVLNEEKLSNLFKNNDDKRIMFSSLFVPTIKETSGLE